MDVTGWGRNTRRFPFLARHGVTSTPRPIACDTAGGCALYEWFDGEAALEQPRPDDVDQLADFVIRLQTLRQAAGAARLRDASASTFSPLEAVAQYRRRLHRLQHVAGEFPDLRSLHRTRSDSLGRDSDSAP